MQLRDIRMQVTELLEKKERIYNSNVNHVEKQSFPPVQTLQKNIVRANQLIRSIHSTHIFVVIVDCSWFANKQFPPFIVDLYSSPAKYEKWINN